ncbi:site-specific DNA-methyltransferase [Candidatus Woesearchaeota archaeon]|nr:site-specific DNA-methyltransferase [Candidatus Woesearchaeota archaeon]
MQNLMNDLTKLFEKDERIFSDGKLLKNKLTELALKLDNSLLELLLSDKRAKENFFVEQSLKEEKVLVFDKDKFISFVNNKEFLPDSFTSFKNKIGLMTNGDYLKEKSDVVLAWAYKDCVLEGGQDKEDQKRDEIFYNETLAPDEIDRLFEPKVLTNFKKYDVKGEHKVKDFNADDNLIIKGNNLLALHSLKKKCRGKVKLIYIDPPFNRDADAFYNDKFRHSTWMTFMKNRLEIAKNFMKEEGSIWISIDDRELHYLKVLCDEIFGKENKISCITVKVKDPAGVGQQSPIFDVCEYLLVYAKNEKAFRESYNKEFKDLVLIDDKVSNYKHFIRDYGQAKKVKSIERAGVGKVDFYQCSKYDIVSCKDLSFNDYIKNRKHIYADYNPNGGMILAIKGDIPKKGLSYIEYVPTKGKAKGKKVKTFFYNQRIMSKLDNILEVQGEDVFRLSKITNSWVMPNASLHLEGGVDFPNGKKPEALFEKIFSFASFQDDLVMDFHLGSGSSCAVAHKMKRQYIGIEQIDYKENDSLTRLKNVVSGDSSGISKAVNWQGGGSFVYAELMEWNEKYMQDIKDADTPRKLINIYEKMSKEAFFRYDIDLVGFDEKEFAKLSLKEQKQVLCECLDKNHLYVNLNEIDDATYNVSADDKKLNKEFYKQGV